MKRDGSGLESWSMEDIEASTADTDSPERLVVEGARCLYANV